MALLILMLPLNFLVFFRERHEIDRQGAGWITGGRFFGTFLGMWVLLALSLRQLEIAVGLLTILGAVIAIMTPPFSPGRTSALGVGLFTGVTETATGIGGPPLALLYQHARGPVLRSTVALCFLVGELISLVILALSGAVSTSRDRGRNIPDTGHDAGHGLVASGPLPPYRRLPALRTAVLIFSMVSGAVLLFKS